MRWRRHREPCWGCRVGGLGRAPAREASAAAYGELGSRSRDAITSAGGAGSTAGLDQERRGEVFNCKTGR